MPISLNLQGPMLSNGEIYLFAVHVIFMAIAFIGAILLIIWMAKNLKPQQLLTWLIVFIVVGLLGSFITFRQEMDFMNKFLWGGNITGTVMNSSQTSVSNNMMGTLQNPSMMKMGQMMSQLDQKCKNEQCQKDINAMMESMMGQVKTYMQDHSL